MTAVAEVVVDPTPAEVLVDSTPEEVAVTPAEVVVDPTPEVETRRAAGLSERGGAGRGDGPAFAALEPTGGVGAQGMRTRAVKDAVSAAGAMAPRTAAGPTAWLAGCARWASPPGESCAGIVAAPPAVAARGWKYRVILTRTPGEKGELVDRTRPRGDAGPLPVVPG